MSIRALAPVAIVASGFEGLSAVAVEPDGSVLVTERPRGTLTRIRASGRREELLNNLYQPTGLAIEPEGGILVVERSRLLRMTRNGLVTIVASGLRRARSVAVGPGGEIWVSERVSGRPESKGDAGGRYVEDMIARVDPSGALAPFASRFRGIRGLAADGSAVYAVVAGLASDRKRERTTLALVPIRPDGGAGEVQGLLRSVPHRALGVARDAVGRIFVSGTSSREGIAPGVILIRWPDGPTIEFATGLNDPAAAAFAPNGDLVAIERKNGGRVVRFLAPPAPTFATPAFTNQALLTLRGTAVAKAAVAIGRPNGHAPISVSVAHAITGAFTLHVPLERNAGNAFTVVATAAEGSGLASRPKHIQVVHDDEPPELTIVEPGPGRHTRGPVFTRVFSRDGSSGVAAVSWDVDAARIAAFENPSPPEPVDQPLTIEVGGLAEGPHVIHMAAVDRAGNHTSRAASILVDRTPPETLILSGPRPDTTDRTARFVVSGTDAWASPVQLDYAWRLDNGLWSTFSALAVIELTALTPGPHRFEIKARDRAGNEDPTPAVETFVVTALRLRIIEPAAGAVVEGPTVWVRGVVEGAAGHLRVSALLPPDAGFPVDKLAVAAEAGTFAAEIPVAQPTTTVAVIAADSSGATAREQITVAVESQVSTFGAGLEVFPPAGTAPHLVSVGTSRTGVRFELDLESDGVVDYDAPAMTGRTFVYARAGIHVATLRVTTDDGQVLTSRAAVEVYDGPALETQLQVVWQGFKDALRSGAVAPAVALVHPDRRASWQDYFEQFTPGMLAAIDEVFTDVALVDVAPGRVEGEMMREVDGLMYSFPISFRMGVDGGWQLWQF